MSGASVYIYYFHNQNIYYNYINPTNYCKNRKEHELSDLIILRKLFMFLIDMNVFRNSEIHSKNRMILNLKIICIALGYF